MLALLQRLLDASYLYAQSEEPLRHWSRSNLIWFCLLLLGIALGRWWAWRQRAGGRPLLAAYLAYWCSLAGLALLVLRVETAGVLSARVWSLAATAMALGAPLAYEIVTRPWLRALRPFGRALAADLAPTDLPLRGAAQAALVAIHLLGLADLAWREYEGLGWWPGFVALACLLLAAWAGARATGVGLRHAVRLELLTPLALPYATSLLRWCIAQGLGVRVDLYQAFAYPNPWAPLFNLRAMLLVCMAWMVLTTGMLIWRCLSHPRGEQSPRRPLPAGAWLGIAILVVGGTWNALLLGKHLSHGVTASDPYCYSQMAIDLAQRGTAFHAFPLLSIVRQEGLYAWPAVHVGYHPLSAGISAYTDWPMGWPLVMVPFYWLAGERGLLLAAPCFALLAGALTWRLAQALWPDRSRGAPWVIGGVAFLIALTSNEGAARSLVPMADAAAQALSVLMLLLLTRARREGRLLWSALAGAALGMVYFVRHPQILLGLAALPALLNASWPRRRRASHLLAFGASALLLALPDLMYHTQISGSPWRSESPEWFLLSWRNIPSAASVAWREGGFGRVEFGYLLPLILIGLYQQWQVRDERPGAYMMMVGFLGVLGFNLFYAALRWRDLISLSPWLALWAGRGAWAMWQRAAGADASYQTCAHRALVLLTVLFLLGARTTFVLAMPWYPRLYIFGHITALERAEYARLADSLPEQAIVASSVNSGAVERYTGKQTVRPASWSSEEVQRFVSAVAQQGYALYLLEDGPEMHGFISRLRGAYPLRPVGEFVLPSFDGGSQWPERVATLHVMLR